MIRQLRLFLPLLFILLNLAGCASVYRQAMNAERAQSGLARKEIVLQDGLRYVYLEGGQGEPLMLLHGFGGNKDNFTRAARFLTPHYRVIVPDNVGFGESSHPQQADYTSAAQVERLRTLAQALGIKTLHVGGNSMGGQIALTYAALYPNEVASLWLLNPAGVWTAPRSETARIVIETGRNPLLVRNEDEFAKLIDFVMSEPPFVPRPILNVMAQERISNVALEERIFSQIVEDSVEKRVAGLATPALIVWGDRDRVIHVDTAGMLHKLMPRSQVVVMPGIGHMPMLERPQQSTEDYLKFRALLPRTPI